LVVLLTFFEQRIGFWGGWDGLSIGNQTRLPDFGGNLEENELFVTDSGLNIVTDF